ncbi:hypothetical protein LINGRAPRIM_LOCUS2648 [Linum grandiflorum]
MQAIINDVYKKQCNRTQMYNETAKIREQRLCGASPTKWFLGEAKRKNYFTDWKVDEGRHITNIFIAHPESVKMLRAWYFIVLIDSTYKTSVYKKAVVQLIAEWLPCRHRWARCYTNSVFHLGNTSTNRVESSHSSFKSWLNSSSHKTDTLILCYDALMSTQVIEVRKLLEDSRLNVINTFMFNE